MHVTLARLEDSPAIARIHVAAWQAAYASLFPAEYLAGLSVADRQESWTGILQNSMSRTLLAKRNDEALGFVTFGHCRDAGASAQRGEIWALYVAPHAWSSGVGWALWEAARVLLLHRGSCEVSLWVLSGNARGMGFYDSLGFRRDPGSTQYFERGSTRLNEVRMVFSNMSACPSMERTSQGPLRALGPGARR